ncbi:hypothetical protein HPQ68_04975 [Massilia sp. erpn]|nr:hypothetical protein HPQ68_04975 [Massilia sp. erpn]
MADMDDSKNPPSAPSAATDSTPAAQRRWLRRTLVGAGATVVVLGGALWLLGRETTLQRLMQQIASASGGQIVVSGVSGSLYGRMHLGHIVYRSEDSIVTADNIDINWSPLQYFSEGIAISELHVEGVTVRSIGPSKPATMPTSLAPPFRLSIADARLQRLTLLGTDNSRNDISAVRLQLQGDGKQWQLKDASALTQIGRVDAQAIIATQAPFALKGQASLSQTTPPAGVKAARLDATIGGNLEVLTVQAKGTSPNANGEATLTLAPFDPVILRTAEVKARGIDPARFDPLWPKADLNLHLQAAVAPGQKLSGSLVLMNQGEAGPLDKQRLPLRSVGARLGGTLAKATLDEVLIDLGVAGKFQGNGSVQRNTDSNAIEVADFRLHTERLDLNAIHASANKTAIAGELKAHSDGKQHQFSAALAQAGLRLDAQATLADQLLRVQQLRLLAKQGSISASGEASLKDGKAFKATATAARFDPSALGSYPAADLNADVRASGKLEPAWQVAADFAFKSSRLLGQPLSGAGKLQADAQRVHAVDARLALGKNMAEVRGSFGAPNDSLNWKLDAPQLAVVSSSLLGAVSASGVASGSFTAPRSTFTADARGLALSTAKTRAPDSLLHASGEVGLDAQHKPELKVAGSASRFNPAAFGIGMSGSIGAEFSASGQLAEDWRGKLDLKLQPSTLSGAPLSGHAYLTADAARIDNADLDLHLGPNALQAKGGFGGAKDRLEWKLDAPQLSSLGPDFGGQLRGSGALSGSMARSALALSLDGGNLRLPGQQQLKTLRASANLGGMEANDALAADVEISGYTGAGATLDRARLQSSGTVGAHSLQLSAVSQDFDASLRLRGGWAKDAWSGTLEALQNKGRYALTLQAPAPLRLAAAPGSGPAGLAKPEQIALSNAVIKLPDGSVRIENLEKNGAHWRSRGAAAGVPASYLAQMSQAWRDSIISDLTIGADWALDMQAPAAKGAAPALDGSLHIFREKGDITVTGGDKPVALGLRQLDTRVNVAGNQLRAQLLLDGARAGKASADATAQLRDGRIPHDSALTLNGNVDMPSLAWLAPLIGIPSLELDGALKANFSGGGTVGAPTLNGSVTGDKLVVNWAEQGIRLRNGQLQAQLAGDQLQLQRLRFEGVQGSAQADGWLRFANAEATMQLKLAADKLEVLARPDRTLVLSGSSTLVRDAKHFQLDGKFRADRASIELPSQDTPTISEDVVILGRGKPAPKADSKSLPLNVDLEADLGDNFYLKGKGLDAQLAGAVRVRIQDRRAPRVNGSIRVSNGTYAAYGQRLAIERGVINFTGAYDNPGLNILAVRKRPEDSQLSETNVEAGVEVRGTALAPSAKLVSTPTVPDSEKLSWLVLGHGMADVAGNEMGLLGTAAGALFGGSGGSLANKVGLDELGVSQAKGLESTVVTVGKRLSSRAYLSFEQGTGSATSLVKLRYKLNSRITLQFQTGTNNALDVLYTWAFD